MWLLQMMEDAGLIHGTQLDQGDHSSSQREQSVGKRWKGRKHPVGKGYGDTFCTLSAPEAGYAISLSLTLLGEPWLFPHGSETVVLVMAVPNNTLSLRTSHSQVLLHSPQGNRARPWGAQGSVFAK